MSTGVCVARRGRRVRFICVVAAGVLASGVSVGALLTIASVATRNLAVAIADRPNASDGWRQAGRRFDASRHGPSHSEAVASLFADRILLDDLFHTAETAGRGDEALRTRLATTSLAGSAWRLTPVQTAPEPSRDAKLAGAPRVISPAEPVRLAELTPATRAVEIAAPAAPPALKPVPDADRTAALSDPASASPVRVVPIPTPRPADFARMAQAPSRAGAVAVGLEMGESKPATPQASRAAALAYAAPELEIKHDGPGDFFNRLLDRDESLRLPRRASRIAVYDIASATVRLPNGERLEAHSGLAHRQDDPRYVREKNRGPTPPNVYDLRMREARFHGSEAIRLLPRDQKKVFNRDGLLAHPYMYTAGGDRSQSNGCVVFKDYGRFLRAFKAGEIARLVVVPNIAELPSYMAGL